MFEKESEEIAKDIYIHHFDDDVNYPEVLKAITVGVQKGAEFGYNKANEWYKPSEKLPEECSLVLTYLFKETEPTICKYVVSNQWECLPKRIVFCSNDQVRKWKEIVLPEVKEK